MGSYSVEDWSDEDGEYVATHKVDASQLAEMNRHLRRIDSNVGTITAAAVIWMILTLVGVICAVIVLLLGADIGGPPGS